LVAKVAFALLDVALVVFKVDRGAELGKDAAAVSEGFVRGGVFGEDLDGEFSELFSVGERDDAKAVGSCVELLAVGFDDGSLDVKGGEDARDVGSRGDFTTERVTVVKSADDFFTFGKEVPEGFVSDAVVSFDHVVKFGSDGSVDGVDVFEKFGDGGDGDVRRELFAALKEFFGFEARRGFVETRGMNVGFEVRDAGLIFELDNVNVIDDFIGKGMTYWFFDYFKRLVRWSFCCWWWCCCCTSCCCCCFCITANRSG